MRITLTLDPDVVALLQDEIHQSGDSLKSSVNRLLRAGFAARAASPAKPFVVTPKPLGLPSHLSYDNVAELLEALERAVHN